MTATSVTGIGPGDAFPGIKGPHNLRDIYVSILSVLSSGGVVVGSLLPEKMFMLNPDALFKQNALGNTSGNPTVYAPGTAAYPTIVFDPAAPTALGNKKFMMWYQGSPIKFTQSNDGITWDAQGVTSGLLASSDHPVVKYDSSAPFSSDGITFYKFQIWYWDSTLLYTISALRTAFSNDGIAWVNDQVLIQDSINVLVTGAVTWNAGSYGATTILVNTLVPYGVARTPNNPMNHRFVMYYNGTDGGSEQTGLAFSNDGITFERWVPYAGANVPVFRYGKSAPPTTPNGTEERMWDFDYSVAFRVIKVNNIFLAVYSGGDDVSHHGVGAAWSNDGIRWARFQKPLSTLLYSPAEVLNYANIRSYTPEIIYDVNRFGSIAFFKIWWSIVGSDTGTKRIAYTESII